MICCQMSVYAKYTQYGLDYAVTHRDSGRAGAILIYLGVMITGELLDLCPSHSPVLEEIY